MRDKVYTYDTAITEVSGTGLRIEMAEELAIDVKGMTKRFDGPPGVH